MRFIDIGRLNLPEGWEKKAREALEAVEALDPGQRAKAINARSAIWSELKPALQALSHNKCWYCESVDLRSDNAVDHFRPKNSVKGSARFPANGAHPGYWWLAFDYRNYRFSCTFCNSIRKSAEGTSGGKQDYFPLWEEGNRAMSKMDDPDQELPILLDPTNLADIGALWFDDSGFAVPQPKRPGESDEEIQVRRDRAEESIKYYHLNHPDIQEARAALARQLRELLENAEKWLRRAAKNDARAREQLAYAMKQVMKALNPDAPYSAAARCVLRGMRGTSQVAELLLEQA